MASTGTAVFPSTSIYPGSSTYSGQGLYPLPVVLYSLASASVSPSWVNASDYLRGFSTSRGRATELARVDAGTASIVLDNRTRLFDPEHTAGIRPMNRWRILEQFSGETQDIFNGYAESYTQVWPDKSGADAATVVACVDEFKVLALDALPTMNPPRDTYEDVVLFDQPQGYWRMQVVDYTAGHIRPTVGDVVMGPLGGSGTTYFVASPIVGDSGANDGLLTAPGVNLARATDVAWSTWADDLTADVLETGGPGDAAGLSAFTVEMWFKSDEAAPAAERVVANGPIAGGANPQWGIRHMTGGTIDAFSQNTGGTISRATGVTQLVANTWYHIALTVDGANTNIYINGVLDDSTAFSGSMRTADASTYMQIGTSTAVGGRRSYDELAFYRTDIGGNRILAHYSAGAYRGFATQDPGARITAVLDAVGSTTPRSIRPGSREMVPQFMTGQDPLSEIRRAEAAEGVDAVFLISRTGAIVFLDDGHRSVSPWTTTDAVFDDDGTDLPYTDIQIDYSESFLANEWNVTRTGGETESASDTTSIARYYKRTQSLTDLAITTESDATAIAASMLAKYKDPMTRVTRVTAVTANPEVSEDLFRIDIGSRIRIFRTPPGGGSRIDQTSFVQSIEVAADRSSPVWTITLGVSPL